MSRFYFDLDDNGIPHSDHDGVEMETPEKARTEALRMLVEMARDQRQVVDEREMVCTVRNAAHEPICRVALAMHCEPLRD